MQAIEQQLGGIFSVYQQIQGGAPIALATVIWAGATSGGTRKGIGDLPTVEDMYSQLLQVGLSDAIKECVEFISIPLLGLKKLSEDDEEEAEEESSEEPNKSAGLSSVG